MSNLSSHYDVFLRRSHYGGSLIQLLIDSFQIRLVLFSYSVHSVDWVLVWADTVLSLFVGFNSSRL